MQSTKKILSIAMIMVLGLWTSIQISAMESPEQQAEEKRLDQLRREQQNPYAQKQTQTMLLNKLEVLQNLQQKQQRGKKSSDKNQLLTTEELYELQNLEQEFQQLPSLQVQKLQQKLQERQSRRQEKLNKQGKKEEKNVEGSQNLQQSQSGKLNRQQNQPHNFNKQSKQQKEPSQRLQQSSQLPQSVVVTKEIAMKQVLLNERDKDLQRLVKQLKSPLHKPMQLQEELERLQIPIDLYLLEPSPELETKAKKIQKQLNQPTAEQQAQQNNMQQQQLEHIQQDQILRQIQQGQTLKQPVHQLPQDLLQKTHQQLDNEHTETSEGDICCIGANGCTEDQAVGVIPCKNKHNDLICQTCLLQIKNKTNTCPICQEPLIK